MISAFADGKMENSMCALILSAGPHTASNAKAAVRVSEPKGEKDSKIGYI